MTTQWLKNLWNRLLISSRKKRAEAARTRERRWMQYTGQLFEEWTQIQTLEDRSLLSVTSSFVDGLLDVEVEVGAGVGESITITRDDNGKVKVNGLNPGGGTTEVACADVRRIEVVGGSGNDSIDLSDVGNVSEFVRLISVSIDGGDGNDTIVGSQFGDSITGGLGNDTIAGGVGDDTYMYDLDAAAGSDLVTENADEGSDTFDFSATTGFAMTISLATQSVQAVSSGKLTLTLSDGDTAVVADTFENVIGGLGADTINGNSADNDLDGGGGSDTIIGGDGADSLTGGAGNDSLVGGLGDDTYLFANDWGTDSVTELSGEGTDAMDFSGVTVSLTVTAATGVVTDGTNIATPSLNQVETVAGGDGDDRFVFAAGAVFAGTSGAFDGGFGSDTLDYSAYTTAVTVNFDTGVATGLGRGQVGFENVVGGVGNDLITGDDQSNRFEGGGGDDTIAGGAGDDTYAYDLDAAAGSDLITEKTDEGSDTFDFSATTGFAVTVSLATPSAQTVSSGKLTLTLSDGDIEVMADTFENVIGGSGNDSLTGNALDNVLTGGPGNDLMTGAAGNDTYRFDADAILGSDTINDSGVSADLLDFSATAAAITVNLATATSQVVVVGKLSLTLSSATTIENVTGGSGADTITGNTLANTLIGGGGGDSMSGSDGGDRIEGGADNDALTGGSGNDTFVFGDGWGTDSIAESSGGGTDTMDFSAVTANLTVTLGSVTVTGDTNTATHSNNNVESVLGGLGDDVFQFGAGVSFAASSGTLDGGDGSDTLDYSLYTSAVTVDLSLGTATGMAGVSQFENVIGGSVGDSLTGDGNANQLSGRGGNDSLTGGAGDDTYVFDADNSLGSDTINESGGGVDHLDFSATTAAITVNLATAGSQTVVSGNLSLTLSSATNIENVTGGEGNDSLTGNSVDNTLGGGPGDEFLFGNGGGDTYLFQAGWGEDGIIFDDNPSVSIIGSFTLESISSGVTATITIDGTKTTDSIFIPTPSGSVSVSGDGTITVATLTTNGASITLDASSVSIEENSTISTRNIGAGLDHFNSPSEGASGDLTIRGTHITIPAGARLLTHVENGSFFAAGDIKLKASDIDFRLSGGSYARINIHGGATLQGGNITLEATADNDEVFGGEPNADDVWTIGVAEELAETLLDPLASISGFVGVNDVAAIASVTVGVGTTIVSSGDVSITATANSGSDVFVLGVLFGIAYSRSQADATVSIETDVSITAAGNVTLDASTENETNAFVTTIFSGAFVKSPVSFDLIVVVAETYSTATTDVAAGATITAGSDFKARAVNVRDISTSGSGGSGSDLLALTVVVNVAASTAEATIDGTVRADGDITVLARSNTLENETSATSTISDSFFAKIFDRVVGAKTSGAMFNLLGRFKASQLEKTSVAAAIGVAVDSNRATARIGSTAIVQAHGDVTVESHVTERFQLSSAAEVGGVSVIAGKAPIRSKNAGAVGIMVGLFNNHSTAVIDSGATVDASGTLSVIALTEKPYSEFDFFEFAQPQDSLGEYFTAIPSSVAEKLNANAGIQKGIFSSWAQASADGEDVSVAFSVNVVNVANTANARIESGAQINQAATYRTSEQDVVVRAENIAETVNLSGTVRFFFEILGGLNKNPFGTSGDKAAIGGSLLSISYQNTAEASIGAATVYADDVTVKADTQTSNISFVASGGSSSGKAINGSGALGLVQNETTAFIASGAVITADGDIKVSATDDAFLLNLAGTVVKGVSTPANGSTAAGASFIVNVLERDTAAYIGTESGTDLSTSGALITAAGKIDVTAENSGLVLGIALAATVTAPAPPDPPDADPLDGLSLPFLFGEAPTGVGISGDAVVNVTRDSAEAYIRDVGTVTATGALHIEADNRTNTAAFAGAVSATAPGSAPTTGIAGSFSSNGVDNDTRAFIERATVTANTMSVSAEQTGLVLAISAGGSGSALSVGSNVAGSVAVNIVLPTTEAYVSDATVTLTGASSVIASDTTQIWSIAGAVGYGGKGGYGVGIALNLVGFSNDTETIPNQPAVTRAFIEDSVIVLAAGTLTVEALADNPSFEPRIVSIAGSVGVAAVPLGTGGAGMIAVNIIKGSTEASVTDTTIIETSEATTASLKVHARDDSRMHAIGGAVGVGGLFGLGAAVGYNEIHSETRASLDNTDVALDGTVNVSADSVAEISQATLGIAVGTLKGAYNGAGSLGINQIVNTTEASITNGSNVNGAGGVTVQATDRSQIVSITGGVAGTLLGPSAVGAAIAYNLISNSVSAFIDSSRVTSASGSVKVDAQSAPLLVAIAMGGAGAQGFAMGGSVAVNSLANTVDAHIGGSIASSTVTAGGDVSVTAAKMASMVVIAGAGAATTAGGTGAFGASLAYNYAGGEFDPENPNAISYNTGAHGSQNPSVAGGDDDASTTAYIDNSSVTAGGRVIVSAGYEAPDLVPLATSSFNSSNVNATSETITLGTHGFETGDAIVYSQGAGNTAVGALTDGTTYFVIRVSDTEVKLATTAEAASNGTEINLTGSGSGSGHSLKPVLDLGVSTVELTANISTQFTSVTVAGAAATTGAAVVVGGAVSINYIRENVDAHISDTPNGQSVTAAGQVQVLAKDSSQLNIGAGGFGINGAVAAGLGVGVTDITNSVTATINNATVQSTGSTVDVEATETARTFNGVLGVAVGNHTVSALAVAGSIASNQISNTVTARIRNGSNVNAAGTVTIQAKDTSSIATLSGNVAVAGGIGTGAIGIAFAVNNVATTVRSEIAGSAVSSTSGDINVSSQFAEPNSLPAGLDAQIAALAVSGAGSGVALTASMAGSFALNWIRNTVEAKIDDVDTVILSGNNVRANAGTIRVHASDESTIHSLAGAVSGTGTGGAVGASVSYNFLGGRPERPGRDRRKRRARRDRRFVRSDQGEHDRRQSQLHRRGGQPHAGRFGGGDLLVGGLDLAEPHSQPRRRRHLRYQQRPRHERGQCHGGRSVHAAIRLWAGKRGGLSRGRRGGGVQRDHQLACGEDQQLDRHIRRQYRTLSTVHVRN